MTDVQTIGIVGLGLIGGSLGLDLRDQGLKVVGVSRRAETAQRALERGLVDASSTEYSLLGEAELIFVCTPIYAIASTVKAIIPHLQPETMITDVGSVKGEIVPELTALWANFIGGHPMAGTNESGVESGFKGLFNQAPYVLTPTATTPKRAIEVMKNIIKRLKSRLYLCSPTDHDQAVAWISHLPVMISSTLIQACLKEENPNVLELAKSLASSGFRDTSRVGGGNPELGVMMAQYNRQEVMRSLLQYQTHLQGIMDVIEAQDWQGLETRLQHTQQARPDFL